MFGVSNLSLFLLATLLLLIYPLRVLLTEKVIKPVQAIQEELSVEEIPKARKRRKGKKAKRSNNQVKRPGAPRPTVQVASLDNDGEDSDELVGESLDQAPDAKTMNDRFVDKANTAEEVESTTDSEGNQAYPPIPADGINENPPEEIAIVPRPVKLFESSVQTEEQDISAAMAELLARILSSDLAAERVDGLRDTFKQGFASKFGPDKAEASLSAECSKLRGQVETMKANMSIAVAVVQRAKQMQDYFKSIEQRYLQNMERLQDRLHKLNISKGNLQQRLAEKSSEVERLKELDSQNRQALQLAKSKSAAISSASLNDLEFYKSECSRLKAEYTSASDLMRAQDLEIQQLRSLANSNKARIEELMNENSVLKERQHMAVPQKQFPQQKMSHAPDEFPSNGQTGMDKCGTCKQTSGLELKMEREDVASTVPEQAGCGVELE